METSLERLEHIADELAAMENLSTTGSPPGLCPGDFGATAGDLINQASTLGAFNRADPIFAQLRMLLRNQQVNYGSGTASGTLASECCPKLGSFHEALNLLAPGYRNERDWPRACPVIAEVIREELRQMRELPPAAKPKQGEANGGKGTASQTTRLDRWKKKARNNPIIAVVLALVAVVTVLAALVSGLQTLTNINWAQRLINRLWP